MRDLKYADVFRLLFLIEHLIFDRCVVQRGSKNKHHEHTCSKEIGHLQILLTSPHSIVNAIERTYVSNEGINTRALLITTDKLGEIQFFCRCFIVDLLLEHM